MVELTVNSSSITEAANSILKCAGDHRIILFYGEMGAGKTTLIKEMCKILGAQDKGSSPTFSIVNEYQTPYAPVYHFDLYRLKNQEELFDIGFEEYLDSGNYCLIEWPEKAEGLLPGNVFSVKITVHGQERKIEMA